MLCVWHYRSHWQAPTAVVTPGAGLSAPTLSSLPGVEIHALEHLLVNRRVSVLVATRRLGARVSRLWNTKDLVEVTIDAPPAAFVMPSDVEHDDHLWRRKADDHPPVAGDSSQMDDTQPLDGLSGEAIVGGMAAAISQVTLDLLDAAAEVGTKLTD
jgi:hypothetical protein